MADEIVITTDGGGSDAADFAEGLAVGAALAEAEAASEQAAAAEVAAEVATVAAFDAEAKYAELQAAVIGLHDQLRGDIAELADAIYLLATEEAEMAEDVAEVAAEAEAAGVDAAIAEAEVTEIVEHEPEQSSEPETAPAGSEPEAAPAPESSDGGADSRNAGSGKRAGRVRFRRGR